jgi:hypothetical protein
MNMNVISEKPIILVGIEYCEGERSLLSTAEIITVPVVFNIDTDGESRSTKL